MSSGVGFEDSLPSPDGAATVTSPVDPGGRALHGRSSADDYRVAVHEASHAVVARLLGVSLGGVSCDPDPSGKFSGLTWGLKFFERYSDDDDAEAPEFCERLRVLMPKAGESREGDVADIVQHAINRVIEIAAGSLGERMLLEGPPWAAPHDRMQETAFARLLCSTPQAAEAFVRFCEAQCRDLLEPHLHIIAQLAAALRVRRALTGEEVDQVITVALAKASVEEERARRAQWRAVEVGARRFEAMRESPLYSETDAIAARQRNDAIMRAAGAAAAP
jgi:hypothetical protein